MNNWRDNDNYYHLHDDLARYPEAWCYVVWSRRGPGKTYSALRYAYEEGIPICYMKRTIADVETVCGIRGGIDLSPYVPINRDGHYHITSQLLYNGIGGFYDQVDDDGKISGPPFSYIVALNALKTVKGFDLSICDWMVLDEFIPQLGEVVRHKEGEMLLDMYMTISRDRQKRGRGDLKLILFANAENISTPITYELDIVDDMIDLQASGKTHHYIEERGILLHHITEEEIPIREEEKTGIYKAMAGTAWGAKAFGGDFANNDFSNVGSVNMKNYQPVVSWHYHGKYTYVYRRDDMLFFTNSRNDTAQLYDLDKENDQKRFYWDWVIDLRNECIQNKCRFKSYTMYDILINYKKFFNVGS